MTHSPYPVVLDACVLYPSLLRDLLMHLGQTGMYQPKWSAMIEDEWQRNLIKDRPDLNSDQIKRTGELMNRALVLLAVNTQRRNMRKPPKSVDEYLDALLRQGLPQTVKELSKFRAVI